MKRLDEILSKRGAIAISEAPSATSAPADSRPRPASLDSACPICGGGGFVRRPRPVDDPRFGRAEPCECVLAEGDEARRGRLERLSNLGALTRFTFDTFRTGEPGRPPESLAAAARMFAEAPEGWLVLSGPSGSGKTHLAAAVANLRVALGQPVLFMVVPDLLDHLRASYDAAEGDLGYDAFLDHLKSAPLLILDDIDAASPTPWAKEKLFQLVNHRYNTQAPTVFTHSDAPGALDQRLATRFNDPSLVRRLSLTPPREGGYLEVGGMTRERLADMNFGNFDVQGIGLSDPERDSLRAAYNVAREFAESPAGWLTMQGASGSGKTHLASAIAGRALRDGRSVFFAVVPDLLDYLRRSFAPNSDYRGDELFEAARTADILILDDLGAHSTSAWAQEKLYQLVNYRSLGRLPAVVTTDQDNDHLADAYPRLFPRLFDGASNFVQILAPHYRLGNLRRPRSAGRRR